MDAEKLRMLDGPNWWGIRLSAQATIVELSALMGTLKNSGIACTAEHVGDGEFVVLPINPGMKPPSTAVIHACMSECKPARLVSLMESIHG